jgi:hypothetical protein
MSPFRLRRHIVTANEMGDWRELFDVALFEPNRVKLRRRIERARLAINRRLEALTLEALTTGPGESARTTSERIALSDALTTLAELYKIVYAPKPNAGAGSQQRRAAG